MPVALDGLNRAQEAAVTHADGPLVVVAGAGTGKTHTVVHRFAWLVDAGRARRADPRAHLLAARRGGPARAARGAARGALRGAPRGDVPLLLPAAAPGRGARGRASTRSSRRSRRPTGSRCCSSGSTTSRCARTRSAATRRRCSRASSRASTALKDEMVSAASTAAHAERLGATADGDAARAHAARELEFARVYADHDRLLAERGALDFGDLVLRAFAAAARAPARARARRAPLPARARGRVPGDELRRGHAAPAADRGAPAGDGRRRRTRASSRSSPRRAS